jgi:hypothetical protein
VPATVERTAGEGKKTLQFLPHDGPKTFVAKSGKSEMTFFLGRQKILGVDMNLKLRVKRGGRAREWLTARGVSY